MSLNQLNDDLNDPFETYYPSRNPLIRIPYLAWSGALLVLHRLRRVVFRGRRLANERIVEEPLVLRWIRPEGRVLDIGCVSSRIPFQLASLGHKVDGLDLRPCPLSHPNFTMHTADALQWEPDGAYDIILLVSTIEHVGLGAYGERGETGRKDHELAARVRRWLKPGGQLIVSVPFGRACVTPLHRVYDGEGLRRLFEGLDWIEACWFVRRDGHWRPAVESEAAAVDSSSMPVNAVGVLHLRRPAE